MSYTTVSEIRAALGVGTLYSDATLQDVCDAADDVLIPFLWSNTYSNIAHRNTTATGYLYFDFKVEDTFYVGQSVTVSGNGSTYVGSRTITELGTDFIGFAITPTTEKPYHPVNPFGKVSAHTYVDYSTISAVQEASLMIAISIWQARQAPSGQGMSVDGFTPSPFTMSNTLLARVRGLLAPYLDPRSMVG